MDSHQRLLLLVSFPPLCFPSRAGFNGSTIQRPISSITRIKTLHQIQNPILAVQNAQDSPLPSIRRPSYELQYLRKRLCRSSSSNKKNQAKNTAKKAFLGRRNSTELRPWRRRESTLFTWLDLQNKLRDMMVRFIKPFFLFRFDRVLTLLFMDS